MTELYKEALWERNQTGRDAILASEQYDEQIKLMKKPRK